MNQNQIKSQGSRHAFSYVRWSSAGQTGNTSLARQTEMAEKICQEKGWSLISVRADKAVSAWKGKNFKEGALGEFVKWCKGEIAKGTVKNPILIVERFDRLSRMEPREANKMINSILDSGISIQTCEGSKMFLDSEGSYDTFDLMKMAMEWGQSSEYSKNLSNRVKQGKGNIYSRIAKGEILNCKDNAPKWIKWISTGKHTGYCELHPENAETVKRIFELYLKNETTHRIAKILDEEKRSTLRGGISWMASSVLRVLRNKGVTGLWKGNDKFFPRIVSDEDFKRVQSLLSKNIKRAGARSKHVNIFRGLLRCSVCGDNVVQTNSDMKKVYRCGRGIRGKCSAKHSMPAFDFEEDFFVSFIGKTPESLLSQSDLSHQNKVNEVQIRLDDIDARISTVSKSISKIAAAGLTIDQLTDELIELQRSKEKTQSEIDALNDQSLREEKSPRAMADLKKIFGVDTEESYKSQEKHYSILKKQLKDSSIREEIASLLPGIIGHVTFDLQNSEYSIFNHSGELQTNRFLAF